MLDSNRPTADRMPLAHGEQVIVELPSSMLCEGTIDHFPDVRQALVRIVNAHGALDSTEVVSLDAIRACVPPIPPDANGRQRLPDTRHGLTHHFSIAGVDGYLTVNLYRNQPREVFIVLSKVGSPIRALTNTAAILTSVALQHGAKISSLADKLEGTSFAPAGETHNDDIKTARSIIDYVFRWLRHTFDVDEEVSA